MVKKFGLSMVAALLLASGATAAEFKNYDAMTKELKAENKKNGLYATTEDVKKAIKDPAWAVVDVRTSEEWAGAHIKGSNRIGRESPEVAIENFVTDVDGKFTKTNIIVVCNSAARASIEAEALRKMGFDKVMIYDIYSWIDQCNPVVTAYSVKKDSSGTGLNFGEYFADHCKAEAKK
mgnify:CR=1 FL=1